MDNIYCLFVAKVLDLNVLDYSRFLVAAVFLILIMKNLFLLMFDIGHFIQYNKQRLGGRIFSPGCRKRLNAFVFARIAAEKRSPGRV